MKNCHRKDSQEQSVQFRLKLIHADLMNLIDSTIQTYPTKRQRNLYKCNLSDVEYSFEWKDISKAESNAD